MTDMTRPAGIPATWKDKSTGFSGVLRHVWPYKDGAGTVLGFVARFDGDGDKVCPSFFKRDGDAWKSGAPPEPRPLYGLDSLQREQTVFIVEGEKCATALHSLGLPAVASLGGAQAAARSDWTPLRRFKRVIIWPDADDAGEHYAETVCRALAALPSSPEVLIARVQP